MKRRSFLMLGSAWSLAACSGEPRSAPEVVGIASAAVVDGGSNGLGDAGSGALSTSCADLGATIAQANAMFSVPGQAPVAIEIVDTDATCAFSAADNGFYGLNALPAITGDIVLFGNGHELSLSTAKGIRFFYIASTASNPLVTRTGSLTLYDLQIDGARFAGGAGGENAGGGAGMGGAIYNQGTFIANRVTFSDNSAMGGAGGVSMPSNSAGGGGGMGGSGGNGNTSTGGGGGGMGSSGGVGGPGVEGDVGAGGGGGGVGVNAAGGGAGLFGGGGGGENSAGTGDTGQGGGPNGGAGGQEHPDAAGANGGQGGVGGGGGGGYIGGNGGNGGPGGGGGGAGSEMAALHATTGGTGGWGGGGGGAALPSQAGAGGEGGGGGGGDSAYSGGNGGFGGGGGGGGGSGTTSGGGAGGFGGGGGGSCAAMGNPGGKSSFGGGDGQVLALGGGGGMGAGGALFNDRGATATIVNCTFASNRANGGSAMGGAAAGGGAFGGAIFNLDATLTVVSSTFDQNLVTSGASGMRIGETMPLVAPLSEGAAIYSITRDLNPDGGSSGSASLTVGNTALGTDGVPEEPPLDAGLEAGGLISACESRNGSTFASLGGNVVDRPGHCAFSAMGDRTAVSLSVGAALVPAASTSVLVPQAMSPLINGGLTSTCSSTLVGAVDERRFPRRIGYCDVGATEVQPAALAYVSGSPQAARALTSFGPVAVTASDGLGDILGGAIVSFSGPDAGASATFTGGKKVALATTVLDSGIAYTVPTANDTAGSYNVVARIPAPKSDAAALASVPFDLVNEPGVQGVGDAALDAPSGSGDSGKGRSVDASDHRDGSVSGDASSVEGGSSGGCSCHVARGEHDESKSAWLLAAPLAWFAMRRRRRSS